MKLVYQVLWFEDNPKSVSEFSRAIGKRLEKEGFEFRVDWGPCDASKMKEKVSALQKYNPYDLILFDYDLGDGLHGEDLAATLRKKIWTEIFYYSAKRTFAALSKGMSKHKVDGVFFAVRRTFEDRLWSIVEAQIKRSCDLNNMRGIVLDTMSEIEVAIRGFLGTRFESFPPEEKSRAIDKLRDVCRERVQGWNAFEDALTEAGFVSALNDYVHFDFQMIRNRLSHIDDCFKDGAVLAKLQTLRNKFAHQAAVFDPVENEIVLTDPKTKRKTSFDYAKFKEIRQNLLAVRKELDKVVKPDSTQK